MFFESVKATQFNKSQWAHGETTELYLYPRDSSYSARTFKWRVSAATVDCETSTFTVLFGVRRWIMPFDATLHLTHANNDKPLYSITLKPYESHCFKGDWETQSIGKASDFNLMLKDDAYGILKPVKISEGTEVMLSTLFHEAFDERLPLAEHQLTLGLYSRDFDLTLKTNDTIQKLHCGDLLLIHYTIEEVDQIKRFSVDHSGEKSGHAVLFAVTTM